MRRTVQNFLSFLMFGGTLLAQNNAPVRAITTNAALAGASPAPAAPPSPDAPALPAAEAAGFWRREIATARRIVGGHTYDISTLVRWYMVPSQTQRPLKAWVLVIGTLGPNTAYGWEVTGFVDGQRQPGSFIIRNPPKELLADFNRRKAAYTSLQQRQSRLQSELQRAQASLADTEDAFRRAAVYRVAGDLLDVRGQTVKDIEADIAAANEALQRFDTGGLDMGGPFVLRCFVMKTGLALDRRLIFDHGAVLK